MEFAVGAERSRFVGTTCHPAIRALSGGTCVLCDRPIAALFVMTDGHYYDLPGVDPWDEPRDARAYAGDDPIVGHPPCARWCRLSGFVESQGGPKRGEDGGCFASALANVRRCGGVLEHPAYSAAWAAHGIARPTRAGGWIAADDFGGFTCHVDQAWYGHLVNKPTWLYACHVDRPELQWGVAPHGRRVYSLPEDPTMRARAIRTGALQRLSRNQKIATPCAFRDVLIAIARTARR